MAIAGKHFEAVYGPDAGFRVYAIVTDGDLMEGISGEASSLAGHLGLDNLIFLYDDNHVTIDGDTELAFTEDRVARYDAYGWHTATVADGNDLAEIDAAVEQALAVEGRPSFIAVKTIIGFGSPRRRHLAGPLRRPRRRAAGRDQAHARVRPRPYFVIPDAALAALPRGGAQRRAAAARVDRADVDASPVAGAAADLGRQHAGAGAGLVLGRREADGDPRRIGQGDRPVGRRRCRSWWADRPT